MDTFSEGGGYERYMGRWSELVAQRFLAWLGLPAGGSWLDVGCGTGALAAAIAVAAAPGRLVGVDPSPQFIRRARERLGVEAELRVGDARSLPFGPDEFDATVSGLALNFVPDPSVAVREMRRVTREGGVVAAYVWDYGEGMEMLRRFWDIATELDPAIRHLDEAERFPFCRPDALTALFAQAGLAGAATAALEIATEFGSFDEFWRPFLAGQGPAPGYVASLAEGDRDRLAEALRTRLPLADGGSIRLMARAWAVRAAVAA